MGGSAATAGSCWGRTGTWEGAEPGGVCCASGIRWHPQDVGVKSEGRQNRGTRKAAVTQVTLVLEVGASPGASQGPDLSSAAGFTGMGTSVVLMPACGGHLGGPMQSPKAKMG